MAVPERPEPTTLRQQVGTLPPYILASTQHLCHEPPFCGASLHIRRSAVSVFPSDNQCVRFLVQGLALADTAGVAGHGSFDGQALLAECSSSNGQLSARCAPHYDVRGWECIALSPDRI